METLGNNDLIKEISQNKMGSFFSKNLTGIKFVNSVKKSEYDEKVENFGKDEAKKQILSQMEPDAICLILPDDLDVVSRPRGKDILITSLMKRKYYRYNVLLRDVQPGKIYWIPGNGYMEI